MRHLMSFMSITVCACMIIGLLVLSHSLSEISAASLQDHRAKMALAANDLEIQQEILETISYKVRTSPLYRPFFTGRNAYYEREVVQDVAKYQDYSPIVSEYYCLLADTDSVYSQNGKMSIEQFLRYKLGMADGRALVERLLSIADFGILEHPTRPDVLLMVATMRIATTRQSAAPDACMIFLVTRADLAQRLNRISGLSTQALSVDWGGVRLLGAEAESAGDQIVVFSPKGGYRVRSGMRVDAIYERLDAFRNYCLLLLAAATGVFVVLAVYLAQRSYRPINRLIAKLNLPQDGSEREIEAAVKALQDSQRYTEARLREDLQEIANQRREIARQLLFAKLNGVRDEKLDALMVEAGIALDHPLLCVLALRCGRTDIAETRVAGLVQSVSDEEMRVYNAGLYQPACFLLLLNFTHPDQLDDVCSVLRESLELEGIPAILHAGDVCDGVDQLPLSLVSALTHREDAPASLPAQTPPGKDNWYEDHDVCLLILALKQGNSRQAKTCLDAVCGTLAEKYPSVILQRCIWADMANLLLKAAKEIGLSLDRKNLHALLMAPDLEGFRRQFSALIDSFSEATAQYSEQVSGEREAEVVEYIRAQLFSPQFTIHQAAERFGLSDRKIGSIVRNATGLTYKEFIIHLRMERAKALLSQEHCNVAQTGEFVGYGNIPYFIKTFRNATGYTPGEYKKMFEK